MEKDEARVQLEALRDELGKLDKSRVGQPFREWYARVTALLREVYGAESRQVREFTQIRFEMSAAAARALRNGLRDIVEGIVPEVAAELRVDDKYLRRGLSEAYEFLTGEIISLRSPGWPGDRPGS